MTNQLCPDWADYWTLDEVGECLSYHSELGEHAGNALYEKLWKWLSVVTGKTPRGGDGTDGTVETPAEPHSRYDDKLSNHWTRLSEDEQLALIHAMERDYPE